MEPSNGGLIWPKYMAKLTHKNNSSGISAACLKSAASSWGSWMRGLNVVCAQLVFAPALVSFLLSWLIGVWISPGLRTAGHPWTGVRQPHAQPHFIMSHMDSDGCVDFMAGCSIANCTRLRIRCERGLFPTAHCGACRSIKRVLLQVNPSSPAASSTGFVIRWEQVGG